jgi:hypothetical protein
MLKIFQHLRQKWVSSVNYRIRLDVSFNVEIISTMFWWQRWGGVNSVWSLCQSLHVRWWSLLIKHMANLHSFLQPKFPLKYCELAILIFTHWIDVFLELYRKQQSLHLQQQIHDKILSFPPCFGVQSRSLLQIPYCCFCQAHVVISQ